ncbi:hypothetical protein [Paraburkholderia sp. SIMBA_054]|uniref:hypothetical protein n=1 Tax=Paraburkholderia sp. SIMBA_054 TaxID=3085795 RepID=UPI00397B36F7
MHESTPRKKPKPLRERMPTVAAHIDALRLAHGQQAVDDRLRRAANGEPAFYAREGPHEFGTLMPTLAPWVAALDEAFNGEFSIVAAEIGPDLPSVTRSEFTASAAQMEGRRFCDGCDGSCVGTAKRCSETAARLAMRKARTVREHSELWASPAIVQPVEAAAPDMDDLVWKSDLDATDALKSRLTSSADAARVSPVQTARCHGTRSTLENDR